MLLFSLAVTASPLDQPYRVLVLQSVRYSLPANTDWYEGIRRGFASEPGVRVEIDIESPALDRFDEEDYVSNLLEVYRQKYHDPKPQLIIPIYTPALRFLLEHGDEVFPGTPIVFSGADSQFVAAQQLPAHITGVTTDAKLATTSTVALISQVHPDTQQIAMIVGSGRLDQQFKRYARQALRPFEDRIEFLWLQGLPIDELTEAVKRLPGHTVILYLIQLEDGAGEPYVPQHTVRALSHIANAPIYGLWETLLGQGIIGGRLATLRDDGSLAAKMGLRVLRGEAPAAMPVVFMKERDAIFDGRELARWSIAEHRLPAGSEIRYRERWLREKHSKAIITAAIIMGMQALLIVALLLSRVRLKRAKAALQSEQQQRERAESNASRLQSKLTQFSKQSTLGTLATSIAHEINQPLIAIQNYAQAARRRLQCNTADKRKLNELLDKVEQQAGRAGAVIQQIRNVLAKDPNLLPPSPTFAFRAPRGPGDVATGNRGPGLPHRLQACQELSYGARRRPGNSAGYNQSAEQCQAQYERP